MKKKLGTLILTMLLALPISCYGAELQNPNVSAENTQAEVSVPLSEEEYYKAVKDNCNAIFVLSEEFNQSISTLDLNDLDSIVNATKTTVEKTKPYYIALRDLNAPPKYAEAQAKIKSGANASIETLDLSVEMVDVALDTSLSSDDITKKIAEFEQRLDEIYPYINDLSEGLFKVLGEDAYKIN